jgi:hypothetical protein
MAFGVTFLTVPSPNSENWAVEARLISRPTRGQPDTKSAFGFLTKPNREVWDEQCRAYFVLLHKLTLILNARMFLQNVMKTGNAQESQPQPQPQPHLHLHLLGPNRRL